MSVLALAALLQGTRSVEPLPPPSETGLAPYWVREARAGAPPELQWLEHEPRLMSSAWNGAAWMPVERARGERWFLNWADVPAAARDASGRTLRSWLPIAGAGPFDYGVRFRFEDAARDLIVEGRLHEHAGGGEHGFVSLAPLPGGGFFAVWLDGRAHAATGQQLRGRAIRADGSLGPELLLDARCCDCCPTAAAALPDGSIVVAWRDRSEDEIRDVAFARGTPEDPASWSAPRAVATDGWRTPG